MSRKTTCTCDRCGKVIEDGVIYTLACYAEDVNKKPWGLSAEATAQNMRQNVTLAGGTKDLCQTCKDELTDGVFIV